MKKIISLILLFFTLSLSSCKIFEEMKTGLEEAKLIVEEFCKELDNENYGNAKSYLHENAYIKQSEFNTYVNSIESENGFAFIDGIVLKKCVGVESTYYNSSYDGSVNELTYSCIIGGKSVYMFFVIIDNDNGQGIYSFGIED